MWKFLNNHPFLGILVVVPLVAEGVARTVRQAVAPTNAATGTKVTL